MANETATQRVRTYTTGELRAMSPTARNAVLAAAADLAQEDYRTDADLTAFEAFAKGDLYGESSSSVSEPR